MTKKELMAITRTKDFINVLIRDGYCECQKNGSSHRIFKKAGSPVLSVPSGELTTGTKRMLVKLILGEEYYK